MKKNVFAFKTSRTEKEEEPQVNPKSKSLIRVEDLSPLEAFALHTTVKEKGRGSIKVFVEHETPYTSYGGYYYQLKKLGVVPLRKGFSGVVVEALEVQKEPTLEEQVLELKRQLAAAKMSPAKRAVDVLYGQFDSLGTRSRSFLCTIIAHDRAHLTAKQEKWLSDLENRTV